MKSNKKIVITMVVVVLFLFIGILVYFYLEDSKTVQQAKIVRAYMVNFCMESARYPKTEELDQKFPGLFGNNDWSYSPGEKLTTGTFQYPMTLPLPSAPGESKFSEFILAYSVDSPCQVFNTEVF